MLRAEDFRLALDHASDGVLIERHDVVTYINPRYASILGYSGPGELIGARICDLAAAEDFERLAEFTRKRERGEVAPERYSFRVRRRDSSVVLVSASVSSARRGDETYITTIVREKRLEDGLPLDELSLAGWDRLAPREREIILLLVRGKRPKEIAFDLDISEKTVGTHRSRGLAKLNLGNDFELFRFAVRHGLIDL